MHRPQPRVRDPENRWGTRVRWFIAGAAAVLAVVALMHGSGAGTEREMRLHEQRNAQLREYGVQATEYGQAVLNAFPADDVQEIYEPEGAVRQLHTYEPEWPKRYQWVQSFALHHDDTRTAVDMVDALEPTLTKLGWERHADREWPPSVSQTERVYLRADYSLHLVVWTSPPPKLQTVDLYVMSPYTAE